jgi:hypothetical protein
MWKEWTVILDSFYTKLLFSYGDKFIAGTAV